MPVMTASALLILTSTLSACAARPLASPGTVTPSVVALSSVPAQGSESTVSPDVPSKSGIPATPLQFGPAPAQRVLAGSGAWRNVQVRVSGDATTAARSVAIFTPPVANPAALPVMYFLHGLPGGASDLCNPGSAAALLAAFRAGAQPFVLACPDGNPAGDSDSEWADSADGRTKLESFVTGSAITAVEGSDLRPRGMRALAGFSMGGFGAAAVALRHPELYSQVVSLAGYFHLDDPDKVFGTTKATQDDHDPTALVSHSAGYRWFLAEADADALALTAHDAERYSALLEKAGATVQLVRTQGSHAAGWAINQLPAAARFLSRGWQV
jgi:S-formylglutathione hydrolase FrmB